MDNYLFYKASDLVEKARALRKSNPEESVKCYLTAAQIFIRMSKHDREYEKDFFDMANQLFEESQTVNAKQNEYLQSIRDLAKKKLSFQDIAGLADLKDEIKLKIIEPFKNPELFKKFNKKVGGGILMFGPPGCGKTMIAEAAANEAGVKFFNVNASTLRSKYVGESEKNIANLFEEARKSSPCIIFFDEFEALGQERSNASTHTKSEVSQLLMEMNGFGNKEQEILIIAASNEPWEIDIALRREGRLGNTIFVPPPDFEARKQMIKSNLKNKPVKSVDMDAIAKLTEGFSGADITSVCEAASDFALKDSIKSGKIREITDKDFYEAMKIRNSSIKPWFNLAIAKLKETGNKDLLKGIEEYAEKARIEHNEFLQAEAV